MSMCLSWRMYRTSDTTSTGSLFCGRTDGWTVGIYPPDRPPQSCCRRHRHRRRRRRRWPAQLERGHRDTYCTGTEEYYCNDDDCGCPYAQDIMRISFSEFRVWLWRVFDSKPDVAKWVGRCTYIVYNNNIMMACVFFLNFSSTLFC